MSQTLVVSSRGRITLPAPIRKRLGLKAGDTLVLEDRGSEIVLKPGVVFEARYYGDEEIAEWDKNDRLSDRERTRILDRIDLTSVSSDEPSGAVVGQTVSED